MGAVHDACNKKAKNNKTLIPCFFHNANYDMKQLILAYEKLNGDFFQEVSCIPMTMEKFKCIQFGNIIILDSYAHLPQSLDSLINDLPDNKKILMKTILNIYDNAIYKNITGKNELPKKNSLQYLALKEYDNRFLIYFMKKV